MREGEGRRERGKGKVLGRGRRGRALGRGEEREIAEERKRERALRRGGRKEFMEGGEWSNIMRGVYI